jgi:magnesium transporter
VDKENRLVGIITVDDALDVIQEEVTEDFERMAAILPSEGEYLKTSAFKHAKSRIVWLSLLMLAGMITGGILSEYEQAVSALPILVTFIPMLTGTGGNSGSQSSTMIIRGMTLGEINTKDIFKVLWKETCVALLCGGALSLLNFIKVILFNPGEYMIALTITLAVFFTVILAKATGAVLPIVAKLLRLDPAVMAAPLITTIVDASSLIIFFNIANILLASRLTV